MANRICPFCKEKVKESATICKHCKSELPCLPPKKWYQTWWGFVSIMLFLSLLVKGFDEKPATPPLTPESTPVQSSTIQSNKSSPTKTEIKIDEKKVLRNSYFGDFSKAKIQKKSGNTKLEIWQPWIQHVRQNLPLQVQNSILSGPNQLTVSYDEIWVAEDDENLTESEKREYKGQLNILKLYWKGGEIQACTVEKFYSGDPATGASLPAPGRKITNIHDRAYILGKI